MTTPRPHPARLSLALVPLVLTLAVLGCGERPADPGATASPAPAELAGPPMRPGARTPHLSAGRDGSVLLSWLEPVGGGEEGELFRLRLSRLAGGVWSAPVTVTESTDLFVNWADFPSVVEGEEGALLAHWLERTGEATYAYGIRLARSDDGGETFTPIGFLHDDATPTEHGFVSLLPEGTGFRAFWLDGRRMEDGGAMTLRTARVVGELVEGSAVIDERVCECCQTGATALPGGALVAYRDRSRGEVRDIYAARLVGGAISAGEPVHADGWEIAGCPVNGPAVDGAGERVVVAWFTGAGETPRVRAALSTDGGESFSAPIEVGSETALGRVGVSLDGRGGAVVSWLAAEGDHGVVLLRRVATGGRRGEPLRLAETAASRAAGFPRILRRGEMLYAAWVEIGEESPSAIRLARLPLAALPPLGGGAP